MYVEHVVFGVAHDVGRQSVEGKEICDFCLFLSVFDLGLADNVGVDNFVSWQKVVFDVFVSVVELHHVFSTLFFMYDSPSLSNLATPNTSCFVIGFKSRLNSSGIAYNFLTIGRV